jgi:hypothetical protein
MWQLGTSSFETHLAPGFHRLGDSTTAPEKETVRVLGN